MNKIILQKSNFRSRESIYICRPLRRLRHLAIEYVKNDQLLLVRYYNAPRRIVVSVFKLPDNFRVTESKSNTITNTIDSNTQ